MALSEDQVAKIIRGFITELRREIPIKEIILFGFYAQSNPKEYSDICGRLPTIRRLGPYNLRSYKKTSSFVINTFANFCLVCFR